MNKLVALFLKLKKKGFFHLLVSNYSVQFIVFASHLLVAKIMLPEDVGIIKTIETFANMAIVLGGGGMIFAILKIIPENKDAEKRGYALRFALRYIALFSLAILLIFNFASFIGLISQDSNVVYWFHIYSLLLIPSVIIQLLVRYYQAVDRFKKISTLIFYLKLVSAIFVLGFTYFYFIRGYVLSMVVTTIFVMGALIYDLRKDLFRASDKDSFLKLKNEIISLSKTAFISQIVDQFKLHSGFLIANYLILDRIEFGLYAFALILIQGLNIVASTVQQFIIPKMSEISKNLELFFNKFRKFEKQYIIISTVIFILSELLFPSLVNIVFGAKYVEAIILIRIMLFGWWLQCFYALKGVVFLSLGKMRYISYSSLIILGISAPVIYYLNSTFGAIGAAIAFLIQNLISLLVLYYFTNRVRLLSINS